MKAFNVIEVFDGPKKKEIKPRICQGQEAISRRGLVGGV